MIKVILALSLISSAAFSDTNAVYLIKSQPAPFTGYLLTPSEAQQMKNNTNAMNTYKLINISLQTSLDLETKSREDSDAKVNILTTDLTDTTKALNEEKSLNNWERVGCFVLGMLATYGALRLASQVNTH